MKDVEDAICIAHSKGAATKLLVGKKEVYKRFGGTRLMKSLYDRLTRAGTTVLVQTGADLAVARVTSKRCVSSTGSSVGPPRAASTRRTRATLNS